MLSAGSEYFAAMFTNDLKEASQNEIELHDVDGDALWSLMHYCYTGKIKLLENTVETLLGRVDKNHSLYEKHYIVISFHHYY